MAAKTKTAKKKTEKKEYKYWATRISTCENEPYYTDKGRFYHSERARRARFAGFNTVRDYETSETFLKRSAAAKKGAAAQKAKREAKKKKAEENPIEVKVKTDVQVIMHAFVKTDYGNYEAREMPLEILDNGKVIGFDINCQRYYVRADKLAASIKAAEQSEEIKAKIAEVVPEELAATVKVDLGVPYQNGAYSKKGEWLTAPFEVKGNHIVLSEDENSYRNYGYKLKLPTKVVDALQELKPKKYKVVEVTDDEKETV